MSITPQSAFSEVHNLPQHAELIMIVNDEVFRQKVVINHCVSKSADNENHRLSSWAFRREWYCVVLTLKQGGEKAMTIIIMLQHEIKNNGDQSGEKCYQDDFFKLDCDH